MKNAKGSLKPKDADVSHFITIDDMRCQGGLSQDFKIHDGYSKHQHTIPMHARQCTHASAHKGFIMFQFLTCSPRWPEAHFEAWAGPKLMQSSCFEQQEWWNSKGKPNVEVAVRYFD